MNTPEPVDETPAAKTEIRGGDRDEDFMSKLPPHVDAFLNDPSTGVMRERPAGLYGDEDE